jgi:hypothetical protein
MLGATMGEIYRTAFDYDQFAVVIPWWISYNTV